MKVEGGRWRGWGWGVRQTSSSISFRVGRRGGRRATETRVEGLRLGTACLMKETYLMWVRILPDDGTTRSQENSSYHIKHSTLAIFNSAPSHSASIPMSERRREDGREEGGQFICRGKLKRGSCKGNLINKQIKKACIYRACNCFLWLFSVNKCVFFSSSSRAARTAVTELFTSLPLLHFHISSLK